MRPHVVEGDKEAIFGKDPADLPQNSVDRSDVVGGGMVHDQVEGIRRQWSRVDVGSLVAQRQALVGSGGSRLLEQFFGIVDPYGLVNQSRGQELTLHPAIPAVEAQRSLKGAFTGLGEMAVPRAR